MEWASSSDEEQEKSKPRKKVVGAVSKPKAPPPYETSIFSFLFLFILSSPKN